MLQLVLLLIAVGTLVGGSLLAARDFATQLRETEDAKQRQHAALSTGDARVGETATGNAVRRSSSSDSTAGDEGVGTGVAPDGALPDGDVRVRYGDGQEVRRCHRTCCLSAAAVTTFTTCAASRSGP